MPIRPPDPILRLAAIVESSDDAIVSKDLYGIITSWNRGAEELFGYTADEAVGQPITIVIPPDRLAEEEMVLGHIRRGERVAHFETIRRRKDGTFVPISLTVSPIRDAAGVIIGASKIARNVSYRRQIEAELDELRHRLLALATASASILGSPDSAAVASAAIDIARDVFAADGYAVWRAKASGSWQIVRSFGISQEFASRAIPGRSGNPVPVVPFSDPLVCEDVEAATIVADMRDEYRREGIVSMIVFPLMIRGERSGTMVFYFRQRTAFREVDIHVGAGLANLVAAALTAADLYEEQRQAREAADHARQQAAFLAEASTVLSSSLDYEATLRSVARLAVPGIADWCAVDIVGEGGALHRIAVAHVDPKKVEFARMLQERYPADPNARDDVHQVIRTGKPAYMARIPPALFEAAARDDEHLHIMRELNLTSYMCLPLTVQGKAIGAITFVSAESGRQYSEEHVRFAGELATRASLAIENARAYERANEASRLRDEFLATLSHELRTPLNAVLGYARMMRTETLPPEKARAAWDVVERNATSLQHIIEDVLEVSRIVAGRLRLHVEPVDLPGILRDAMATVIPAADARGVRVETLIEPLTAPVSGDADRLQQVVWNLLSNAIKFTPRGGKVQLRLSRVSSHVEVTVSDTGRGISPDFLPFIFERFRQADASFTREHGGLGLGLAIAKQLAELHGGTITASSGGPDQGATFTLKLPLMIVHQPVAPEHQRQHPHSDRRPPELTTSPRLDGIHILAVDDEPDSLDLLRMVLEGAGATVSTACSGPEALAAIGQRVPDALIADVGMPAMDGLQLIRAIRQMQEPARSIPAAALTAYARSQDRITSLASGFHMHLVKPIDPLELLVAVATLAPKRLGTN
ncbi:MAG TPA: ATP-binding protein [Vicinamibacterales bacterium]|nr:ATP-binding protein [Vicinamibacterales bacterium]